MTDLKNNTEMAECGSSRCCRPIVLAVISFVLVLCFFILREYWGQVLGFGAYLLLIICPLLHLFHCHGCHHGCCKSGDSSQSGGCCR